MPRSCAVRFMLIGLLVAFLAPHAKTDVEGELHFQLKADLAAALQREANALWQEKNEAGLHYQRGAYSQRYQKIDE